MAYTLNPALRREILSQAGTDRELAAVLAATALAESGGRLNARGDSGHSWGPYQENDQGRGAGIPVSDRQNPASSTRRAIAEFRRFRTSDPGQWAADAQRPADRAGYRSRVNSLMDEARRLLGVGGQVQRARTGLQGERQGPPPSQTPPGGNDDLATALLRRAPGQGLFRTVLQNAMSSPLPQPAPTTEPQPSAQPGQPTPQDEYQGSHPTGGRGQLIGTPNAGTHTLGNWQSDNAVDLRVPEGTPIYSAFEGTIGDRIGSLGSGGRFAGERLTVQGRNNAAYYAHLSRILVRAGQRVRRGQLLGYSGSANGVPHLHWGVQSGDPRQLLGG